MGLFIIVHNMVSPLMLQCSYLRYLLYKQWCTQVASHFCPSVWELWARTTVKASVKIGDILLIFVNQESRHQTEFLQVLPLFMQNNKYIRGPKIKNKQNHYWYFETNSLVLTLNMSLMI